MAFCDANVILRGEFFTSSKSREKCHVVLTRDRLFYYVIKDSSKGRIYVEKSLRWFDVVGCHDDGEVGRRNTPARGTSFCCDNLCFEDSDDDVTSHDQIPEPETPTVQQTNVVTPLDDVSVAEGDCCTFGFVVFAYVQKKKRFSKSITRRRRAVRFELRGGQGSADQLRRKVEKWKNLIVCLSSGIPVNTEGR